MFHHLPHDNKVNPTIRACDRYPWEHSCGDPSISSSYDDDDEEDDDDDDDDLFDDPLQYPFITSTNTAWDANQASESIRQDVLPLFPISRPLSPLRSCSLSSSSSSSDCSTSVTMMPPPSILRFEHYSQKKWSTKFLFDVDGDDEDDEDEGDEEKEDDSHDFTDDWIQKESLQVPHLGHPLQKHQFKGRDCGLTVPIESIRDIVWSPSPPPALRMRMHPSSTFSIAQGNTPVVCQHSSSPTLGIQPMTNCHLASSRCDCHGSSCRQQPQSTKSGNKMTTRTRTPSTLASTTLDMPHLVALRPMVIWVPSKYGIDGVDDDDDDDASALTLEVHRPPPPSPPMTCGLPTTMPTATITTTTMNTLHSGFALLLDEPDFLLPKQQPQRRYDAHFDKLPTTTTTLRTSTRDVWTNHELDWLTDEEDSLSTLSTAFSDSSQSNSNSSSGWYEDEEEDEF